MNCTYEETEKCKNCTDDRNEICKNCKHLRRLWWWKNYPKDKQFGWCCDLFNNKRDDYTLMQLYSLYSLCEMFSPVNGWDEDGNAMPGGLFDNEEKEDGR